MTNYELIKEHIETQVKKAEEEGKTYDLGFWNEVKQEWNSRDTEPTKEAI